MLVVWCAALLLLTSPGESKRSKSKKVSGEDLKVKLGKPEDPLSFYDLRNETHDDIQTETTRQSRPPLRFPCSCQNGGCGCCAGMNIKGLSFNKRRTCLNLNYDPNDFALTVNIAMNDRSIFNQRISAKNPPPLCLPMPIPFIPIPKLCAKVFNVFTPGANFHLCFMFEAFLGKKTLLRLKFDCLRVGLNGLALLKPEDNGGRLDGGLFGSGGFFGGGGGGLFGGGGGGGVQHDPVDVGGGGGGGGDYGGGGGGGDYGGGGGEEGGGGGGDYGNVDYQQRDANTTITEEKAEEAEEE